MISPSTRPRRTLALVAIAIIAVAGCGGSSATTSPEEAAKEAACQDLTDLEGSISSFRQLEPVTTDKQMVQTGITTIQDQWAALKQSIEALADAEKAALQDDVAALEAAAQETAAAVQALPDDVAISEALGPVQEAANDLQPPFDALSVGMACAN